MAEATYTKHDCVWLEFDAWCHATQCLLHAKKYEPESYNTGNPEDESPVTGHPCKMRAGCGFCLRDQSRNLDEQRPHVMMASVEEMAAWENEKDIDYMRWLEKEIAEKQKSLEEVKARVREFEERHK